MAPERCLIDVNAKDHTLSDDCYYEWFDWKSIGDLRAEGLDVADDVAQSDEYEWDNGEEQARNLYGETWNRDQVGMPDPALRRVRVRYVWCRFDCDGDGINEPTVLPTRASRSV